MKKGSITVEAAFVLPVFMFFILGLYYFFVILLANASIQEALTDTANTASLQGYFEKEMSPLLLQLEFQKNLGKNYYGKQCVMNKVISLGRSYYEEKDVVLIAEYGVRIPLPVWNQKIIWKKQSMRTRVFVGKDAGEENAGAETERYVYITETGKVYHESLECTHLKLSIEAANSSFVETLRNQAGGKYKECERCIKDKELPLPHIVFITREGDRYHALRDCSGLKRSVRKVRFEEVKTWSGCRRCSSM